jgi:hypothetical protein
MPCSTSLSTSCDAAGGETSSSSASFPTDLGPRVKAIKTCMCPGETCTSVGNPRRAISPISTGLGRSTNLINVGNNINVSSTSFSLST